MRTRPGLRYSWKPASARPVFWMCGLVIARPRPAAPANSSSGSPNASGRLLRNAPTEIPACDIWASGVGLNERELAVSPPVQDAQRRRLQVAEHDDVAAVRLHLACGIGDRHGSQRLSRGP